MTQFFSFITLIGLLTLTACKNEYSGAAVETRTNESTEKIIAKTKVLLDLTGVYHSCTASLLYNGFYNELTVNIENSNYELVESLSPNADCSLPYKEVKISYTIDEIIDLGNHSIDLDMVFVSYEINLINPVYIGQNYCGETNWVSGVYKEVTGLECPSYFSFDPYHTSARAVGDNEYRRVVLSPTSLSISILHSESGDNISERHQSNLILLSKQ